MEDPNLFLKEDEQMDLDKVIEEANRLLDILATLDPTETETTEEVTTYDPNTGKRIATTKTTRKPKYDHVQALWIKFMEQHRAEDNNAQENNSKEYKADMERERLTLDQMKFELEKFKAELEAKRLEIQKEERAKELDLKQTELNMKLDEAEEKKTYTKKQAAWEIAKLGFKVVGDIAVPVIAICTIGKWETSGCLIGGTKAKFIPTRKI